jgi:hypothetical protein
MDGKSQLHFLEKKKVCKPTTIFCCNVYALTTQVIAEDLAANCQT